MPPARSMPWPPATESLRKKLQAPSAHDQRNPLCPWYLFCVGVCPDFRLSFCCMNTLYLDIFRGSAGDRSLARRLDLAANFGPSEAELENFSPGACKSQPARGRRSTSKALKFA